MEIRNMKKSKQLLIIAFVLTCKVIFGQEKYNETFLVKEDVTIQLNSKYTNIRFETWNKDKVAVIGTVEGVNLSKEEKNKIFKEWNLNAKGNSSLIEINSNSNANRRHVTNDMQSSVIEAVTEMEFIHPLIESIINPLVETFTEFPISEEFAENMSTLNFDFGSYKKNPESYMKKWEKEVEKEIKKAEGKQGKKSKMAEKKRIKELKTKKKALKIQLKQVPEKGFLGFPKPPFTNKMKGIDFEKEDYFKNKKAYVKELNKRYNSDVNVKEVDVWVVKLEKWEADLQKNADVWMKSIGEKLRNNFGDELEEKIEAMADNIEISMGDLGEQLGKMAENMAFDFEFKTENSKGKKTIKFHNSPESHSKKTNKILVIKIPKRANLNINVRYGNVELGDVKNSLNANLNYSSLIAKSVQNSATTINASYSPVHVENWKDGVLNLKYVKDCTLKNVGRLSLNSNSSDVQITNLNREAIINGSFGDLLVENIGASFENLDIVLENTDASVKLPTANFSIYYNGDKSKIKYPTALKVSESKNGTSTIVKGYRGSRNNDRSVHISAKYSDVILE